VSRCDPVDVGCYAFSIPICIEQSLMNTGRRSTHLSWILLAGLAGCALAPSASLTLPEAIAQSDSQAFLLHPKEVARAFNIELTLIDPPPASLSAPGLVPQAYQARALNPMMRDTVRYHVVRDNSTAVTRAAFSFQLTGESCVKEIDVFSVAKGFSIFHGSPYAPGRHWNRRAGKAEMLLTFDASSGCLSSAQMFDES